jgi:hypothetical protein
MIAYSTALLLVSALPATAYDYYNSDYYYHWQISVNRGTVTLQEKKD